MSSWKMRRDLYPKKFNQGWLHEFVVIWNAQGDHTFAAEMIVESCGQFALVDFLYDEDQFSPFNKLNRDSCLSILAQTSLRTLDTLMIGKHLLCRGTAPFVLATDEKYTCHFMGSGMRSCINRHQI